TRWRRLGPGRASRPASRITLPWPRADSLARFPVDPPDVLARGTHLARSNDFLDVVLADRRGLESLPDCDSDGAAAGVDLEVDRGTEVGNGRAHLPVGPATRRGSMRRLVIKKLPEAETGPSRRKVSR